MLVYRRVFAVQGLGILYILSWETTLVKQSGSQHDEATLETVSKPTVELSSRHSPPALPPECIPDSGLMGPEAKSEGITTEMPFKKLIWMSYLNQYQV